MADQEVGDGGSQREIDCVVDQEVFLLNFRNVIYVLCIILNRNTCNCLNSLYFPCQNCIGEQDQFQKMNGLRVKSTFYFTND